MRFHVIVLLTCFAANVAWGQTDAKELENALKGKQFELRTFSSDRIAHYIWQDGKLVDTPSSVRTLGVFTPSSVKLKGQKLSIIGSRATLIRDTKKNALKLVGKSETEIQIDLNGAEPAVVLPQLRDVLFFPDVKSAIAALPEPLVRSVPAPVPFEASESPCKCNRFLRDGRWEEVPQDDPKWKQVVLVRKQDPDFSEEARSAKVEGAVRLMFLIDTKGRPTDMWMIVSIGYGLDEAAEDALKHYVFTPATYDGQPVATELAVDINFQVF